MAKNSNNTNKNKAGASNTKNTYSFVSSMETSLYQPEYILNDTISGKSRQISFK